MICFLVYGIGLNPYHFGLDKYSIDPHDVPHNLAKQATFVSGEDNRVDVGEGYCV
jgi:hypothetical protein